MDVILKGESVTLTPENRDEERWLTMLVTATLDGGKIIVEAKGQDERLTFEITQPAGKMN